MKRFALVILAWGLLFAIAPAQADWTANTRLTWNAGDSLFSAIAADSSGYLHVLWGDWTPGNSEVYYKRSMDGGATWSTNKRLSWNAGESAWPAIAVDAFDNLHVFWEDATPGKSEIYYTKSTDGGTTWSAAKRLTWSADTSWGPVIALDLTGVLFVVWFDRTPGQYEILYRKSTNGGTTWLTSKYISQNSGHSCEPVIAVDPSDNLHMVWYDYTFGNTEILYKRGTAWTVPIKRLTWTAGESRFPDIAVDPSGDLHLVWWDNTPGKAVIYYKQTLDEGATWSTNLRLTWNSGDSYCPRITADPSDNLHVVWHNNSTGNYEIYYKKFIK